MTSTLSVEKATILAEIFSKTTSLCASDQPLAFTPRASCTMFEVHIRSREVKRVLAKLDIKKSSGPEGIPARAKPLRNLFCISFKTGKLPSCWQIANVQPVPKKGNPTDPEIYRPIAICSNLAKVIESILNHKLMKYLEDNSCLSICQYGFRKNRSTEHNIL